VLEVSVTYPRLQAGAGVSEADAERFNRAYSRMAEAFLSWAEGEPAHAAEEAFLSMGAGAAYRFDRRMILCNMTASIVRESRSQGVEFLRVMRQISWGCKRGWGDRKTVVHEDIWRIPSLTLVRRPPSDLVPCADGACRI
jgi:hypothetical protein